MLDGVSLRASWRGVSLLNCVEKLDGHGDGMDALAPRNQYASKIFPRSSARQLQL